MSHLRIGIDYRPALIGRSGVGRYVRELVQALPAVMGNTELTLFGACWKNIGPRLLPEGMTQAKLVAPRFPGRFLQSLGKMKLLHVETLTGEVDLFHRTDYVDLPLRTKNQLVTIHDVGFLRQPDWYEPKSCQRILEVTRNLIRQASHIAVVSETTAHDVIDRLHVEEDRVSVTPLGVEDAFSNLATPPESPEQILMVGTLEPRKNHRRVLSAWEKIAKKFPESKLVVVGARGWLDDDLVVEISRLTAMGIVDWRGNVDDAGLYQAMSESSIVLYPSLWEGFGLPLLEGMAAGRAVMTSNLGSMKEVAGDGALLIDPFSVEEMAEGLEHLLLDSKRRRALGAAGRLRSRRFTWRRCAQETCGAWQRVLEEGRQ